MRNTMRAFRRAHLELVSKTMSEPKKTNNMKTGLILGALAIFFFAMVFIKRVWLS
jgi:hypothetical protein